MKLVGLNIIEKNKYQETIGRIYFIVHLKHFFFKNNNLLPRLAQQSPPLGNKNECISIICPHVLPKGLI